MDIQKIANQASLNDAASATESAVPEETEDEEDAASGVWIPGSVMTSACALGWLAIAL